MARPPSVTSFSVNSIFQLMITLSLLTLGFLSSDESRLEYCPRVHLLSIDHNRFVESCVLAVVTIVQFCEAFQRHIISPWHYTESGAIGAYPIS